MRATRRRGQGLTEFALVLPILVLIIFGILDLGRVIYYYVGVSEAIGEGGRAASLATNGLPTNADVLAAARSQAGYINLAPCPNGPVPAGSANLPPAGTGWLYITGPSSGPANPNSENAPGGEAAAPAAGSCQATVPALSQGDRLQVTVVYNFVPFTPVIAQVTGSQIVLRPASIFKVEY